MNLAATKSSDQNNLIATINQYERENCTHLALDYIADSHISIRYACRFSFENDYKYLWLVLS